MPKHYYTIDYYFDSVDSELHLDIYDGEKHLYTEVIPGSFEDKNDIRLTCQEIAASRGYIPFVFKEDEEAKKMRSEGARKAALAVKKKHGVEHYRKLAEHMNKIKKNKQS